MKVNARGVLTVPAVDDGEPVRLRLGFNELCDLEDEFGMSATAVFERLQNQPETREMRRVVRVLMKGAMELGDPEPDLVAAGEAVNRMGGLAALGQALEAMMADASGGGGEGAEGNGTPAPAGPA